MANGTSSPDFTGVTLLQVANSYDARIQDSLLKNSSVQSSYFLTNPRTEIENEIQKLEESNESLNFIKNGTDENRLVGEILAHCFKHACAPFLKDPTKPVVANNINMPAGGTYELLQKFTDARAFAASQSLRILADIPAIKNMDEKTRACFLREFDAKCQTGLIKVLSSVIELSRNRRSKDRQKNYSIISPVGAFLLGELKRKMANGISPDFRDFQDFTGVTLLEVANSYNTRIKDSLLTNTSVKSSYFATNPRTEIENKIQQLEASNRPFNFITNKTHENRLVGEILAHCFKHACAPFLKNPEKEITGNNIVMPAGGTHELLQKLTDARAFSASQSLRILADIPAIKNMDEETRACFLREFDAKCQKGLIAVLSLVIELSENRRSEDRNRNGVELAIKDALKEVQAIFQAAGGRG